MTEMINAWLQFLIQHDARIDADTLQIAGFERAPQRETLTQGFIAPLTDLGLIAASGEDARHFLHSQLTNDVEHLGASEARLAGYCSPKGR
ncbi:MAG TPA: folate-binding protein, partial [Noviherbaspirillum sp.]